VIPINEKHPRTEFSKKIMIFATVIFAAIANGVENPAHASPENALKPAIFRLAFSVLNAVRYAWTAAVFSWFYVGEIPADLLRYSHLIYGACCASYFCKSAYENKPKIESGIERKG